MKTITALPEIPASWAWVRGHLGRWQSVGPHTKAALDDAAVYLKTTPLACGTPPAGSTVWDPQALDWALYQPESV